MSLNGALPASTGSGLLAILVAGCGDAAPNTEPLIRTDSAGIQVVYSAALPGPDEGIRVGAVPLITIGTVDGDTASRFSRVVGGARLADGRILVVDGDSRQVRVFDAGGRHVRSWSRRGNGPGELESPSVAGMHGDTLVLLDAGNRRVVWLDPDAGVVHEAPVEGEAGGFLQARGIFGDGSVLSGGGLYFRPQDGGLPSGAARPPTSYVRIDRAGTVATDFGSFPGLEMFFETSGGGMSAQLLPFGRITAAAAAGDRVHVATGDGPEIRSYGSDGTVRRILRWDDVTREVTAADRREWIEESLSGVEDPEQERRIRLLGRDHAAEHIPPYQTLLSDRLGLLWLRRYLTPGEQVPRYLVFDREGRGLGVTSVPAGAEPLDIGSDYMLARRFDELDVEYVELYRVERP